jgi:CHAT domain-containing protein
MEKVYEQYQETALFMLENDYHDKAFKYTGSMKARVFLDLLAEGLKKFEKGINRELQQKRDGLVAKLSLLSKEISEAAVKKDEKKLNLLKDKYSKIENEFEDLLVKIRLENPLYASVQYPEPISVADLQKNILKRNEVLIQYFITGEKVYVFLVSRKDFKVVALAIKEKDIQAVVNRYFIAVNKKDTGKMVEYGKKIYQAIFKPLETSLQMNKDIIIVPDRQLATIPFESFVIDDTNPNRVVYLLEKYRVKYIQSASALSFLRKYHKKKDGPSHFIGFGDPVYDYENFREGKPERGIPGPVKGDEIKEIHRGKYDREGGIYSRLQGSGQEVATITGLFKSKNQKGIVYLREQANEENAKAADMKEFDYIHFSCHGILGENFQSLVLSQIPDSKEDGYLTMNEIMNCDYNAKLVVLSACETGTGKMERAEGVTGLTRAFMYAGTPAVVASLWNVSEMGTKELMVKFYTNMLEKELSKEEALRQAKLEMINGGKYSSPYFWSSFIMYGE